MTRRESQQSILSQALLTALHVDDDAVGPESSGLDVLFLPTPQNEQIGIAASFGHSSEEGDVDRNRFIDTEYEGLDAEFAHYLHHGMSFFESDNADELYVLMDASRRLGKAARMKWDKAKFLTSAAHRENIIRFKTKPLRTGSYSAIDRRDALAMLLLLWPDANDIPESFYKIDIKRIQQERLSLLGEHPLANLLRNDEVLRPGHTEDTQRRMAMIDYTGFTGEIEGAMLSNQSTNVESIFETETYALAMNNSDSSRNTVFSPAVIARESEQPVIQGVIFSQPREGNAPVTDTTVPKLDRNVSYKPTGIVPGGSVSELDVQALRKNSIAQKLKERRKKEQEAKERAAFYQSE